MKCNKVRYLPTGKGQRMFLHSLSSFFCKHCFCSHKWKFSEAFAYAKVKLLCSEVRAIARVKLSLPTLPKAKLHDPQDHFTYEVNFTCPQGQTQLRSVLKDTTHIGGIFCMGAFLISYASGGKVLESGFNFR